MILTFLDKHRDIGLLVLRIGLGCMFLFHGASETVWGSREVGRARRSNGESRHYVSTNILGLHGCDFGVFGGHLSHPRSLR